MFRRQYNSIEIVSRVIAKLLRCRRKPDDVEIAVQTISNGEAGG